MADETVIKVDNISKSYTLGRKENNSIQNIFKDILHKKNEIRHQALKNISFEINKGEVIGIIGKNGAGKSTLLKVISKITKADSGEIRIKGKVSSMLEIGTGFHKDLTGRENIFLNGAILGMKRMEIAKKFDQILAFSEIEAFIDTPVKYYSSGMYMRLAFSVAVHLEADIILIDEVFAVGDAIFQQKSIDKIFELFHQKKTIVLVSHNLSLLRNLCTKILLLEKGEIIKAGMPEDIIAYYTENELEVQQNEIYLFDLPRNKSQKSGLLFEKIYFDKNTYFPADSFKAFIALKKNEAVLFKELNISLTLFDALGNCIYHLSNVFLNQMIDKHEEGRIYIFSIPNLHLHSGRYSLNLHLIANMELQDWLQHVIILEIQKGNIYGTQATPKGIVQPVFHFSVQ